MSRAKARKRRQHLRARGAREVADATKLGVDRLERRLVLDVSFSWDGLALGVDASGDSQGDTIAVGSFAGGDGNLYAGVWVNGNLKFNGSTSNPVAPAANVLSIHVEGSEYADSLDLSAVTKGNGFTHVPRDGVEVFGLTGNDTIKLGDFGEYAEGGFGNDSIIGGPGPDTIYGGNADGTEGGYDYIDGQGGNDYLVAESTAGAQRYDGNGDPIPSSEVYGGDGNDFITDATALDYLSGDGGNDEIAAGGGPNRFRDFRFFSKKVLAAGRAA